MCKRNDPEIVVFPVDTSNCTVPFMQCLSVAGLYLYLFTNKISLESDTGCHLMLKDHTSVFACFHLFDYKSHIICMTANSFPRDIIDF